MNERGDRQAVKLEAAYYSYKRVARISQQWQDPPLLRDLDDLEARKRHRLAQCRFRHPSIVLDDGTAAADIGLGHPVHTGERREDRPRRMDGGHPTDRETRDGSWTTIGHGEG